jgi:indolepyruvate ferredoxin oxidoreductase
LTLALRQLIEHLPFSDSADQVVGKDPGYTIDLDLDPSIVKIPSDGIFPPEGVHYNPRLSDPVRDDRLIKRYKLPLAHLFARANNLDRAAIAKGERPRLGLVTAGKSYGDTLQALRLLGIDAGRAQALGISLYKVGMIWPLEPQQISDFAEGQDELLVIEEKAAFLEPQLCSLLINETPRARVVGKHDEAGNFLLPSDLQIEPMDVAFVIAARLESLGVADDSLRDAVTALRARTANVRLEVPRHFVRAPYYCSGCPHNTSLKLPQGSTAFAGMGCHAMAMFYESATNMTCMQMGGEGANWIGLAPFVETRHVFQNLGDGTYHHSGSLAIRASVAAGTNITYKILVNGVIAMTGGQAIAGPLSVARFQIRSTTKASATSR